MKTILRNLLSVLRRFKMATALNVLGLSVAFAAFMIIMMQVDYDRGFDRSHPDYDRIFRMEVGNVNLGNNRQAIVSRPLIEAFIQSSPHITAGAYASQPYQVFFTVEAGGGKNAYLESSRDVSTGYTRVFTFDMLEGSDRALEDPEKVLIPESLARRIFGAEAATGRRLEGTSRVYTVGGVFRDFPGNASTSNVVYIPIPADENINNWGNWNYVAYLRLNEPGNVDGLTDNFRKALDTSILPEWMQGNLEKLAIMFTPLADTHFVTGVAYDSTPKASRQTVLILFGIAIIIVLIAGINYMNFSAALAPKRIRSINTQKVLGCRGRVLRSALVAEAAIIAGISYLIGLGMVVMAGDTPLASLVEADISLSAHTGLAVLTGGVALVTGILAGLYPALYMTSFPPAMVLKGSFGLSPQGRQLRNALISVQFIASFALIIGASFMYLQNYFMQHAPLGYDKDQIIIADINGNINKSRDAFTDRMKSFAGVEDVTYSQFLISSGDHYMGWGRAYHDRNINYTCLPVEPSFLRVMGIEVSEGRDFRPEDANTRHGVYVFNEKARRAYDLQLNDNIDSTEIVGFMPDVKFASFRMEVAPMAFIVWGTQDQWDMTRYAYVKVQAGADLRAAIAHVRGTLREFDDEYLFDVRFFDEVLDRMYTKELALGTLISLFSLVAILISIVGVFGLVVFESEYRRREISLRKVFGSTTGQILVMFNRTYLRILALCFVVAAPAAWYAVSRWLENFAYRTPLYWWVYCAAFAVVAALTVLTVTFQSRRAANANPAESIRAE
ncbi:MAG: ABC transporter permease [Tannerellaceae bacterium]|jgi:putative ABC transport system permease protein|nr:ABC transporter permease [Tannerellaceae bacterium]